MRKMIQETILSRNLLLAIGLLAIPNQTMAEVNCQTPPPCEELGYVYSASDCNGISAVKCPFNTSKLFCNKSVTTTVPDSGSDSSSDLSRYTMITQSLADSMGSGDLFKLFRGNTKFALSENVSYGGRYISDYETEIILDGQGHT